jgi:hypothetical protein
MTEAENFLTKRKVEEFNMYKDTSSANSVK